MIAVEHGYTLPSCGFAFRQTELRSPSLLVVRRRLRGARSSDHLFNLASRRPTAWPCVRIVLSGEAIASVDGREVRLGPGDAVIGDHFDAMPWTTTSDDGDTIFVTWPEAATSGPGVLPALSSTHLPAAAERLASSMSQEAPRHAAVAGAKNLLAVLAAEGIIDDPRRFHDSGSEPPEAFARFATALGGVLSQRTGWPMTVDLASALGIGERQVTRLASSYFRSLYVSVDSLGAYLARARMWVATAAMTNPRARTEDVAKHFGFSSPVALCHAFTAAGLPSPRLVRRALLDLHAA